MGGGTSSPEPVLVPMPKPADGLSVLWPQQVAVGEDFICFIADLTGVTSVTGEVYCVGNNNYRQLGGADTVASSIKRVKLPNPAARLTDNNYRLFAGKKHACVITKGAIKDSFELVCWGDNRQGQLGLALPDESVAATAVRWSAP